MSSSRRDAADWVAQEGASDRQGAPMTPSDLTGEETREPSSEPEAMPIGYPISPEEYRRMKEEASRQQTLPGNMAQQDAATDEGDH